MNTYFANQLWAGVKRTVGDRRNRIANNLRVRRATVALSKVTDLNELSVAMKAMLEIEEFACASLELGRAGNVDLDESASSASEYSQEYPRIENRNGQLVWSWSRDGVNENDLSGSRDYWCFRLPLSTSSGEWGWLNLYRQLDGPPLLLDMNYLAGFFRTELAEAVGRILQSSAKPVSTDDLTAAKRPLVMAAGKSAI